MLSDSFRYVGIVNRTPHEIVEALYSLIAGIEHRCGGHHDLLVGVGSVTWITANRKQLDRLAAIRVIPILMRGVQLSIRTFFFDSLVLIVGVELIIVFVTSIACSDLAHEVVVEHGVSHLRVGSDCFCVHTEASFSLIELVQLLLLSNSWENFLDV